MICRKANVMCMCCQFFVEIPETVQRLVLELETIFLFSKKKHFTQNPCEPLHLTKLCILNDSRITRKIFRLSDVNRRLMSIVLYVFIKNDTQ